mmetsp:Transcript_23843/g.48703  ORF Transcript_23843/g.48703 Transcript_23843/m.48703 type:complete len:208 (-) Transcript_23843:28-651(-)
MKTMAGPGSVLDVADAVLSDAVLRLGLGQVGRVVDLAHPRVAAALLEVQPRGRGVRHDVAPDRLLRVRVEAHPVHLRHNLVGDDHRHPELVSDALESAQEEPQVLLAAGELASPCVVGAVQRGRAVDDNERVTRLRHHASRLREELHLVVGVVCPRVCHVVQHVVSVQTVSLSDCDEALRTECPFRVDVQRFALCPTRFQRKLTSDA